MLLLGVLFYLCGAPLSYGNLDEPSGIVDILLTRVHRPSNLQDECLEPRKPEPEEVNLIDFNIEIEKSKLPTDFESVVPSKSIESSSKKNDVAGNEGPVGTAKAQDFPGVQRKEKPRKKTLLAPNFFAPKKQ